MPVGLRRGKVSCCCHGTISGCAQGLALLGAALGSRTDSDRGAFPSCSTSGPSGRGLWRAGVTCARVGVLHVPRALAPGAFALDCFCHGGGNQAPCETFPVPPALLLLFLQPSHFMSCEEKLKPCHPPHCLAVRAAAAVCSGCPGSRALELPRGTQRRRLRAVLVLLGGAAAPAALLGCPVSPAWSCSAMEAVGAAFFQLRGGVPCARREGTGALPH